MYHSSVASAQAELYAPSLHDALPISLSQTTHPGIRIGDTEVFPERVTPTSDGTVYAGSVKGNVYRASPGESVALPWIRTSDENRSEEHTSELQSRENLVCRLRLEKQK